MDVDGGVVVDGSGRVGNLQGDRSTGWEVNVPGQLSTGLLSKVLEGGSGRLSSWDGGDEVWGSSAGPADQSGLTSDQGSWRVDLELLSKSDGGERNGNESFSEHDCLVVNEKGW